MLGSHHSPIPARMASRILPGIACTVALFGWLTYVSLTCPLLRHCRAAGHTPLVAPKLSQVNKLQRFKE